MDPHNCEWFVKRLGIIDQYGIRNTLHDLRPEQLEFVDAFQKYQRICVLKPRQIGMTTIVTACLFWKAYTSNEPIGTLAITHEAEACGRINMMLKNFHRTLPPQLRCTLLKDNMKGIQFGHNEAMFRQLMAGGRSQARAFTFQNLHCTEMGLWPKGSSAREGNSVDEDVWASALATIHQSDNTHVIIESTADGPSGVFYKMVKTSRESHLWKFLFFPWHMFEEYQTDVPPNWEMTEYEKELKELGLTERQIAWRRMKIYDEGYGLLRFRREYPMNWEEPFLLSGGMWFDTEKLNHIINRIPAARMNDESDLVIYEPHKPQYKYFIGGDAAGGTERDWSVWQVLRDDLTQVAVYRSKKVKPRQFAEAGAKLSAKYGRCPVLCESNSYGKTVIKRMTELGTRLWKDSKGKDWWTQGGKAGQSKKMMYDYGAHLVNDGYIAFNDPVTVNELLHVREQANGNIEADMGNHDDHADALMLACWNARRQYSGREQQTETNTHRQRMKRLRHLEEG